MILYLSYDGLTDPLGSSQVLPYIKSLAGRGYQFIIVSFEKDGVFETGKQAILDEIAELDITWIPLNYTKKPPVLSTIWDIYRLNRCVKQLLKTHRVKATHCRSYITSIVGLGIKRKKGIPFIFDMRGFYADERVDGHIWNLCNPIFSAVYKYFKSKEKEFLVEADQVISLTFKARKIIQSWELTKKEVQIEVIPTCVDTQLFDKNSIDKTQLEELRRDLSFQEGDFVLSYIGSLGTWYMFTEMIRFFELFREEVPHAKFLIITKDNINAMYPEFEKRGIPKSAIIVRSSSRDMVPYYIELSNWSIFFIKPVFSKSASAPTKMGELASMNVPFLCNSGVGDLDELTKKYDLGFVVDALDESTFYQGINYMKENPNKIISGEIVEELYSLSSAVDKIDEIYQRLLFG